jgi:hypothetical protein
MSPQNWLEFILDIVDSYRKGQKRPLQQLAQRLSKLDGDDRDDNADDPITEKIWGRSHRGQQNDV